jgi:hypothetical protein
MKRFEARLAPVVDRWIEDVKGQGVDGAKLVAAARAAIARRAKEGNAWDSVKK